MLQPIFPARIRFREVWRIQDQNCSAHVFVYFAIQFNHARFVEQYRRWLLVFPITTQVKSLGYRVREDVVIGVVQVWKFDGGALLNGDDSGSELVMLLLHFHGM